MTTLPNSSPSKTEENEKLTDSAKKSTEQNQSTSIELDRAVYQAERAVLENLTKFDNLKSATEEEIDRQIIHDEIDPVIKAEDRLTTAVHLKLLPEFIKYYLTTNKTKIKQATLKQVFRLLFSSFIAGGKNSLEIVLPILEIIDSGESLTPEVLERISQELGVKILFWLRHELIVLNENPVKALTILKKIVDDLNISTRTVDDNELDEALSCF
jgi:hypothetical protein